MGGEANVMTSLYWKEEIPYPSVSGYCNGSVGQLVWHQLVMGSTAGAALGLAFVQPEPDDRAVVFFTDAAHDPLVGDGGDQVRVFLGT